MDCGLPPLGSRLLLELARPRQSVALCKDAPSYSRRGGARYQMSYRLSCDIILWEIILNDCKMHMQKSESAFNQQLTRIICNGFHHSTACRRWVWCCCWRRIFLRILNVRHLVHTGRSSQGDGTKHCNNFSQNRFTKYSTKTSEEFNTASRSVKPGLIASGIVSAWTWAATLLQASTVAYEYGVAGPFWA